MLYTHKKKTPPTRIEPELPANRIKNYILRSVHLRAAKNPQSKLTVMVCESLGITQDDLPAHEVIQTPFERLRKMGGTNAVAVSFIMEDGVPEPEVYTSHE